MSIDRSVRLAACALVACGFTWTASAAPAREPVVETAVAAPEPAALRETLRQLIAQARDQVFPALVNIDVVTVRYYGGQEYKSQSVGSGTIISPEGYVLTNYHVTSGGRTFRCTLTDKQEADAVLVGEDPLTDLAVLKLNLDDLRPGSLTVARFGDSDLLEVGDTVLAMGSPFALSRSVTLGIASNLERVFAGGLGGGGEEAMEIEPGQRTGLFTRWIQHDALINPGNSGGPLVNLAGEVIGVNELGGRSLGFAIPGNLSQEVAAALIEHGEVPRSWIGVSFRALADTGFERGVLVDSVVEDGPAARGGLKPGDRVIRLDGEPVDVLFAEQLPPFVKRIADAAIGGTLRFELVGDDEAARTVSVETERLQADRGDQAEFRAWGLTAQEITPRLSRELRRGSDGVWVSGVRGGAPAQTAEPALAAGDVITAVAGRPVADFAGFIRLYEELTTGPEPPESVVVDFERRSLRFVTLLETREPKPEEPPRELPKGWLGVATQPVPRSLAAALGDGEAVGFRVTRVYPGTSADASGLRVGDLIQSVAEEALRPRGLQDTGLLNRTVRRHRPGDSVPVELLRGGERVSLDVSLDRGRVTPEEARRDRDGDFELVVRELTFFDRDENRWGEDIQGVLAIQVESAGWSGLAGLRPGDLLLRIDGRPVRGLSSYRKALDAVAAERPDRVVFVVLRGSRTHFLFIEPDWGPVAASMPKGATEPGQEAQP